MSWIFSAAPLFILLLHCLPVTIGEQGKTMIVDNWYGGFKGRIELKITDDVTSGWTMTLSFPDPTPNLEIWRAEIVDNIDDKVYTMKNKPWNWQLSKGTVFKLEFIAKKSVADGDPPIGTVTFNRGAPPTGQPSTVGPSPPNPTTTRPNPTPSRPPKTTGLSTSQPPRTTKRPPSTPLTKPTTGVPSTPGKYNYDQVLKLSILFYEAQRSGKLPKKNRVKWRKDSALKDKGENGEDLTGGWYDAGDYVKFGFPMASSVTVLAWGLVEYKKAYQAAGQYNYMLNSIKWATDYFIKAHVKKYEFYGQVGDGHIDHAYWGRPEDMTMSRPAWKITPQKPGSDLAAETAAALGAASIAFKARNTRSSKKYAAKLLKHAKELYEFADKYRGKYSDSIPNADSFYRSFSGYKDELAWGAAWLYRATKDGSYLTKAEKYYNDFGMNGQAWALSWDDKKAGVQLLLAQLTKKKSYEAAIKSSLDSWLPGGSVPYTPKGLAWRIKWGSNRYAANTAFLALVAADHGITPTAYRNFAKKQIHYMLGDSGRSFVVGFGKNPPKRPHHSSSSCPSAPKPCGWDNFKSPEPNAHVLKGALVGGPDQNDNYKDDRTDYVVNEVATDYNAGFQSAVAGLKQLEIS
ncbi:endoglucanase A-like [Oculina patagonica]